MSSLFGVKVQEAGSCIAVAGVMVARLGMNMEATTVLPGSTKKVIAEISNQ
jgi:hypothetical protein